MRGTYRPDRHRADTTVPALATVPRPPASLSAGAKVQWRGIVKQLHELGLLTALDLNAVEAYSRIRARALQCEHELARDGLTVATGDGGRKRHPLLVTAEKCWADCAKYEAQFGGTPSARRGLKMSESPASDAAAGTGDPDMDRLFGKARFFGHST